VCSVSPSWATTSPIYRSAIRSRPYAA